MHINRIFFIVLVVAILLQSCGGTRYSYKDIDKRKVLVKTDDDVIEAAVYDGFETKRILPDRNYYWFDHSMIMSTRGGFTGELLHGEFLVQYRNYQIKEQGNFKYGLKHGAWKSWYENGLPKNFATYKKGLLHGRYTEFDGKGKKIEEGKYVKGVKTGVAKQYDADGKQAKKQYKNGEEVVPKGKATKQESDSKDGQKEKVSDKATQKAIPKDKPATPESEKKKVDEPQTKTANKPTKEKSSNSNKKDDPKTANDKKQTK